MRVAAPPNPVSGAAGGGQGGLPNHGLDEQVDTDTEQVSIGTMHLAKGLEFRAVAVMACDDEVVPLQQRMTPWRTKPISARWTTQSATCSMWPARVRGTA